MLDLSCLESLDAGFDDGDSLFTVSVHIITATDSGFGTDTNRVTLLDREGRTTELPLLTKYEVGHEILDRVAKVVA